MNSESPIGIDIFFVIFVLILVDLAIWTFFGKYGRVDRKRGLLIPFIVIHCICVLGILVMIGVPVILLPLFLPVMVIFGRSHYRSIRFCESCSRCILSHYAFGPAAYCPYCGAKIGK